MRITKEVKERTRKTILERSAALFQELGYEKTTTRDISTACGVAKGTLFNYFPSKETLAMTLVAEAMHQGRIKYFKRRTGNESLAENLFLFIATELRALRPFRTFIGPVLESTMSVFSKTSSCPVGESARLTHIKTMQHILSHHGYLIDDDSIAIPLYWSLYLGILANWSRDESTHQQHTLTLLDYSMKVFETTVTGSLANNEESPHE